MSTEAVVRSDHPGLFVVPVGGRRRSDEQVTGASIDTRHVGPRPQPRAGGAPRRQLGRALRRYCAGCSRVTTHGAYAIGAPPNAFQIHRLTAAPASGTTVCVDCGQWRARVLGVEPSGGVAVADGAA